MPVRRTPRHSPSPVPVEKSVNTPRPANPAPGSTTGNTDTPTANTPKLPHEHDESVANTDGTPDVQVQQAYRDVKRGLQDTSRGAEADTAYKKLQH
ncbi:hypothetical protein [Rhodoferax sp.]|uniref:hypothetical protein n=1 Tax=Rhodoferax sp. TaxID=50421 RepID=UPI00374DC771